MRNPKLIGCQINRWTVLAFAFAKPPHEYYVCRCECGTEKAVQGNSLLSGTTKSCGCLRREVSKHIRTKHDACNHPAYQSWTAMKRRCQSPDFVSYKSYGARGIKVCDEWQAFEGFWKDMGPTWQAGLSIGRIDNNADYQKINCRWENPQQQASNKRNTVWIDTPWGRLNQTEAARKAGIGLGTLIGRMKSGWPKETWFLPANRKK